MRFVNAVELEDLTGQPVRSEYRMPSTSAGVPPADVVLACPLTFNSVNKLAHGHADNFRGGAVVRDGGVRGAGGGRAALQAAAVQPSRVRASLDTLRGMGVRVLFDPDAPYERRLPTWREVIAALPALSGPKAAT